MKRTDSERPNSHNESKQCSPSKENEKSAHRSVAGKFAPAENDRKVTRDDFYEFLASAKKVRLEKFIWANCFRFSMDRAAAQDICSETVIQVLEAINKDTVYESKFEGFCFTIAYRLTLRELNTRKKNGYGFNHATAGEEKDRGFDFDSMPDRKCASPEVVASLKEAITKLDHREQQVFTLDTDGIKDRDIAEILGTSEGNVRQIRYRAIVKLRKNS